MFENADQLFNDYTFNKTFQEYSPIGQPTLYSRWSIIKKPNAERALMKVEADEDEVKETVQEIHKLMVRPKKAALLY